MKALSKCVVGLTMAWVLGGCAMASGGNGSVSGFLYSGYKMGGAINPTVGTKTGEACASTILGWIATGDASITAAKTAGGITQVSHVDHDNMSILGLYGKSCTIVVGQ